MAEVVGGVGISHVPVLGLAIDRGTDTEPSWGTLFTEKIPAGRSALSTIDHDVAILIYNDHAAAFGMELIPTFTLGVAETFDPADEGYGARAVPPVLGAPELAWHLAESLILDEFDMAIANEMPVDHGCTVPLTVVYDAPTTWPCPVIPLCVNVIQHPPPTARRCFRLGQAIRRAIESYPTDDRVLVVGTGGMSHQLQGTRAGLINDAFDEWFIDKLSADPDAVAQLDHGSLIREAGSEGVELVMWLIMRGALGADVRELYRATHAPVSNTHFGMVVLDARAD